VSKQTISTITDKVLDGMAEWQNRPLDPVIFLDAIPVKVKLDRPAQGHLGPLAPNLLPRIRQCGQSGAQRKRKGWSSSR
jgi:hypothetical protein